MDVDFAEPEDYKEPEVKEKAEEKPAENEVKYEDVPDESFIPFLGSGNRLDGKNVDNTASNSNVQYRSRRGIPDYDYEIGTLHFIRSSPSNNNEKSSSKSFTPFIGTGTTCRERKNQVDN